MSGMLTVKFTNLQSLFSPQSISDYMLWVRLLSFAQSLLAIPSPGCVLYSQCTRICNIYPGPVERPDLLKAYHFNDIFLHFQKNPIYLRFPLF